MKQELKKFVEAILSNPISVAKQKKVGATRTYFLKSAKTGSTLNTYVEVFNDTYTVYACDSSVVLLEGRYFPKRNSWVINSVLEKVRLSQAVECLRKIRVATKEVI